MGFDTQRDSSQWVSTNLACKLARALTIQLIKFPEPTTHPRLRLAAKLSLGDVTPEITRSALQIQMRTAIRLKAATNCAMSTLA